MPNKCYHLRCFYLFFLMIMATGAAPPMTENGFYKQMAKVDEFLKPIAGSSHTSCSNITKQPTVYDVIKAGLLVPTQNFVKSLGPVVLHQKDEKGHTAAHWACLGGHTQVLRYLIEQGAPIDEAADPEPRQLPIHWACTNGHIAVVDILLQHGVSIDSVDAKGCTPLIVAAQYGHTMLAGYLMGKGARLQITDVNGDNALHWAGFKGHDELMRLLIYSGFSVRQKDDYGQTVLHLAAINGNLSAIKQMCEQDSVELNVEDKNGKTPYMLAAGRKHEEVMSFLKKQIDKQKSVLHRIDLKSLVFGPEGNSKYPILFFLSVMFFWGYPLYLWKFSVRVIQYLPHQRGSHPFHSLTTIVHGCVYAVCTPFFKCLFNTWDLLWPEHVIFWISNVVMWISLYHANTIDPGFLPRNLPEYDMAIKQIAHFSEWKEGDNPLSRLCHTCRSTKPARSKHCKICNRCVDHFDHHCPWIYNCVGYRNRHWFCAFIGFVSFNYLFALRFYLIVYHLEGLGFVLIGSVPIMMFGFVMTVALFLMTVYQMSQNLTTNEGINWKRYAYLHDVNGKFKNPYNRGFFKNVLEYFHYLPPRNLQNLESVKVT